MKPYTLEIDIDLPRDQVIQIFKDPDNLFHWQNGLQSIEPLSGAPGEVGSRTKLVYENGRHRIELIETITKQQLPDAFDGNYEWAGGKNSLVNHFVELTPSRTRWISTCSYEFKSIFLKLMGFLTPGTFRRQNLAFMQNFKAFSENGVSVDARANSSS